MEKGMDKHINCSANTISQILLHLVSKMSDILPRRAELPHIVDDLLWKIFVKADPKTVGRCKTLSKAWNFHLSTPIFIKQNWKENKARKQDLIVGIGYPPSDQNSQWFVRAHVESGAEHQLSIPVAINNFGFYSMVGSDHGVICLRFSQGGLNCRLLIWNPLTRRMKFVLDEARKYRAHAISLYAFGYTYDSMEYRILHVNKKQLQGKSMSWTLYNSWDADWKDSGSFESNVTKMGPKSVVNNGVVYWIGWDGLSLTDPSSIITFDLRQKLAYEAEVPDGAKSTYHSLTNFNDSVAFISYKNLGYTRTVVVWGIQSNGQGKMEWEKMIKLSGLGIPYNPTMFVGMDIVSILESRSGFEGDTERTDIVISKIKWKSAIRAHILHRVWQEIVYVKTSTLHSDGLYIV